MKPVEGKCGDGSSLWEYLSRKDLLWKPKLVQYSETFDYIRLVVWSELIYRYETPV